MLAPRFLAPALVAALLLLPLSPAGADPRPSIFVPRGATLTVDFHRGGYDLVVRPPSVPAPDFQAAPGRSCTLVGESYYVETYIGNGPEVCDWIWTTVAPPQHLGITMAGGPGYAGDVFVEDLDGSWFAVECSNVAAGSDGAWGDLPPGANCFVQGYGKDVFDYTEWVAGEESYNPGVLHGTVSP